MATWSSCAASPTPVPDGLPDLYVLNPGWGELLLVGNFNSSDYEAYVIELVRRQYRSWQMNASYTWSKAVGDAEDFNQILGNERTLFEEARRNELTVAHVRAATLAMVSAVDDGVGRVLDKLEELKVVIRLCKELDVFPNLNSFQYSLNEVVGSFMQNDHSAE